MRSTSATLRYAFLAILTGLAPPAWADDLAAPRVSRSRLASGREVTVASHRCLAELNDAVRVGDDVLVATAGGGLRLAAETAPDNDAPQFKRPGELGANARPRRPRRRHPHRRLQRDRDRHVRHGASRGRATRGPRPRHVGAGRRALLRHADGTLWNAGEDGWLRRFAEGRWRRVASLDVRPRSEPRVLSAKGPPWMVFDASGEGVWRLAPGRAGIEPRLGFLGERDDGVPLAHAAAPWAEGTILRRASSPATASAGPGAEAAGG